MPKSATQIPPAGALVFDVDGVLTDTAALHRRAWKETFDAVLRAHVGQNARPFDEADYRRWVDGRPRYDGVRAFLRSRDLELPEGQEDAAPGLDTVHAIGNRKNRRFRDLLDEEGTTAFPDARGFVERARKHAVGAAAVTASRNGRRVLRAAGLDGFFDVVVDGVDADRLGLAGKPDPAAFLEATAELGADPAGAVLFEDSRVGVEAGRRGGFGRVVGVDREADPARDQALREAGAHRVVHDLSEAEDLLPPVPLPTRPILELPRALDHVADIVGRVGPRPAVLLDYDGTLTPIVDDPAEARMPEATREELRGLARRCPVAVVSGRDLGLLRDFVGIDGIVYAGSHGLELREADGSTHERAVDWIPLLDRARERLAALPDDVPGVTLEPKRFGLAVHTRRLADRDREGEVVERVRRVAADVSRDDRGLRLQAGKEVVELRPDLPWDKGAAVEWILERMAAPGTPGAPTGALYVGDDVTDEDAFRGLPGDGVGIVVQGEGDRRETRAGFRLEDPHRVRRFLAALAERLADPRRGGTP